MALEQILSETWNACGRHEDGDGEARLTWELEGEGGADESDDEREHFCHYSIE